MTADKLLTELARILSQEGARSQKAKAIAEAIRAEGAYMWTGIYDVDYTRGIVSNISWSGSGARHT